MDKYVVTNYAMGQKKSTVTIEAPSVDAAIRQADALNPTALGLPGTVKGAGSKSRVIGIVRA